MNFKFIGTIEDNINLPIIERFNVDDLIECIKLSTDNSKELDLELQVTVVDSNGIIRIQHLCSNEKNSIFLSNDSEKSSIGTYPGEIVMGEWSIIINAFPAQEIRCSSYSIQIEGQALDCVEEQDLIGNECWVNYESEEGQLTLNNYDMNKVFEEESRWYKGDFHTHTILSDGKMDNKLLHERMDIMELDFVATTEHNILPTGWYGSDKLIIPGIEITLPKGHFNIIGSNEYPINFDELVNIDKMLTNIFNKEKNRDAVYSINHPFLKEWAFKYYDLELSKINTIEVCNEPAFYHAPKSNDKALKLLDILWNDGHRIYGVGGSDAHMLPTEKYEDTNETSLVGDPGTYVFTNELSAQSIINGVKRGHVYISRSLELDIEIKVSGKQYLPGDEIEIGKLHLNIEYGIKVKNFKEELKAYLIENGETIEESSIINGYVNFKRIWESNEYKWIRVEIRNLYGEFRGFINPNFIGNKRKSLSTLGDAIKQLN